MSTYYLPRGAVVRERGTADRLDADPSVTERFVANGFVTHRNAAGRFADKHVVGQPLRRRPARHRPPPRVHPSTCRYGGSRGTRPASPTRTGFRRSGRPAYRGPDLAERVPLPARADADVTWLARGGDDRATALLSAVAAAGFPPGEAYAPPTSKATCVRAVISSTHAP